MSISFAARRFGAASMTNTCFGEELLHLLGSSRAIEQQVSSVLSKFNASNRMEVPRRVRNKSYLRGGEA